MDGDGFGGDGGGAPWFERARAVADAVLWEGYLLYPYRASALKNQLRWQFGVLAPRGTDSAESSYAQTECLVVPTGAAPALAGRVRFLQLRRRDADLACGPSWDEGMVREVDVRTALVPGAREVFPFEMPGGEEDGWCMRPLSGALMVSTEPVPGTDTGTDTDTDSLLKVRLRVENHTATRAGAHRPELLHGSLVGTHTLMAVARGRFLSQADPPAWAAAAGAACRNEHTWPALIDDATVLSAPIILDDRPRIAPESPVDLCDGTEIDELLTLRTLTLTDEEKREARATDDRAAAIIDHADTITPAALQRLHGVLRTPGPDDGVRVPGGWAAPGARVRLRPGPRRADAQDMFLRDRTARVAAVLRDLDGRAYLGVNLDDDPAADLHRSVGRHLYFDPDEVELLCE